ncbi:MAG: GNAT family N-acetyltransferase [Ginsengibacter sp.]
MSSYIISTERLGLRRWIEEDVAPFTEMNKDVEVMKYFPKVLSDQETFEMVQRINLHYDRNNFGLFAVEDKLTKEFLGITGFAVPSFEAFFTPCVEIGWRFKKEVWGQGFATEAASACLKYGFDTLGFDKVFSFTSRINSKSEEVMKKIGMIKAGEFEHPKIEVTNILCKHVLYEINNENYSLPGKSYTSTDKNIFIQ